MLFRTPRHRDGGHHYHHAHRSTSLSQIYGSLPYAGVAVGAPSVRDSGDLVARHRLERPNSAPSAPFLSSGASDVMRVEQRLKIIKRNRATRRTYSPVPADTAGMTGTSAGAAGAKATRSTKACTPPCTAYPTFSVRRLSQQEQRALDAMATDCLNVLLLA